MASLKHTLVLAITSIFLFFILTSLLIHTFKEVSTDTVFTFGCPLSLILFSYITAIILAWIAGSWWIALGLTGLSTLFAYLTVVKTGQPLFFAYSVLFIGVWGFMAWEHKRCKEIIVQDSLDVEERVKEKNILEQSFVQKAKALEIFLNTYSDYSSLSHIIDDFSSTLALDKVCTLIVNNAFRIIGKGELVLLYLINLEENSLSLYASKSIDRRRRTKIKKGDVFDQWVLKYRQQLLVSDITKDVRFDKQLSPAGEECRSTIATPLIYESRVVGTLRVNSEHADMFTTDDLRALSIIGNLASASLSNAFLYKKTEELALKDSLTGLFVHRYFKRRLKEEYKRALLTSTALTLLMVDFDYFKTYNDRYGHAAGDLILKKVGDIFRSHVAENGFVARYGGEEFAILLPKADKNRGIQLAEELRTMVEQERFELRGIDTRITISIGIASIPQDTLDSEELIRLADARLYAAKDAGRNTIAGEQSRA